MSSSSSIDDKKKLFQLPFKEDELEYWGPLDHHLSNSFLTIANNFFTRYLGGQDIKTVKTVFSAFVELVQNVAEYNESKLENHIYPSYVKVGFHGHEVHIKTANQLLSKDVDLLRERLEGLESASSEELQQKYKDALINNKSLGLIMISRMDNTTLNWEIHQQENQYWLQVALKITYGKA